MITALARYFTFFLRLHTIASGSCPFAGFISPRSSMALIVFRLTETGRMTSSYLKRRRTGFPPSESVSS